jgi:hypothetical protein
MGQPNQLTPSISLATAPLDDCFEPKKENGACAIIRFMASGIALLKKVKH